MNECVLAVLRTVQPETNLSRLHLIRGGQHRGGTSVDLLTNMRHDLTETVINEWTDMANQWMLSAVLTERNLQSVLF